MSKVKALLQKAAELRAEAKRIEALPEVQAWQKSRYAAAIGAAMIGHKVWCRNGKFALEATPCCEVRCTFKKARVLATAFELATCNTFAVTTNAADWQYARHIAVES